MLVITAEQVRLFAPMPRVVDALQEAFRTPCVAPARQVAKMPGPHEERLFLSMPAFHPDGSAAVKLVTLCSNNQSKGLPTIQGAIVVFSESGTPIALLDGTTVTRLRTGAASALASRYLSRANSTHLVLIGTGCLAPSMAAAHCAIRPISRISVYGRRPERVLVTVAAIQSRVPQSVEVRAASSIEHVVASADIVSCATSSPTPVLEGKWLRPGTFVDLVGSFSPERRESDDEVVRRSRVFVDTFDGALAEAGDILDPLRRGIISRDRIEGELADLVCGRVDGRRTADEITTFKSVGTAIEDLAAARMIVSAAREAGA